MKGRRAPPAAASRARSARDLTPWLCVLVALVAFGVYANTLGHGYALDDAVVITGNAFTRAGVAGIPDLLAHDSFHGYFGDETHYVAGGRYRPLSLVSFALEHQIVGDAPRVSHAVNAVLFALCSVLAFLVLARLLGEARPASWHPTPALLAALLFAVHPVHTEVVANIKGRDEILALLLSLAALGMALRAADGSRAGSWVAAAGAFFAALLAKESAITFLAVVPLSLAMFRPEARAGLRALGVLAVPAAVFFLLRQSVVGGGAVADELMNDPFLGASIAERWATLLTILGDYLRLLVWPRTLTYDYYPYHVGLTSFAAAGPWIALLLYAALASVAAIAVTRARPLAYGIAFYAITLSATSNAVVPVGTFMAERFLFTPSLGACLVAGFCVHALAARIAPAAQPVACAVLALLLLVPLAARTWTRNPDWKDTRTLVLHDVEISSGSAQAQAAAADQWVRAAREAGDAGARRRLGERARNHADEALRIHPRYARAWTIRAYAHRHLLGDIDAAIADYEGLLAVSPRAPDAAYNLGTLLLAHHEERIAEAVHWLEQAARQAPEDASTHRNLAAALYAHGDRDAAAASLARAAALRPEDATLREELEALHAEIAAGREAP